MSRRVGSEGVWLLALAIGGCGPGRVVDGATQADASETEGGGPTSSSEAGDGDAPTSDDPSGDGDGDDPSGDGDGDDPTGDGDGDDPTGDGDGDGDDGDDSSGDGDGDAPAVDATLLYVRNEVDELAQIDLELLEEQTLCSFDEDVHYRSLAWMRGYTGPDHLYAIGPGAGDEANDEIVELDPCTCEVLEVYDSGQQGLEASEVIEISVDSSPYSVFTMIAAGQAQPQGFTLLFSPEPDAHGQPLAQPVGEAGMTRDPESGDYFVLDGEHDVLYTIEMSDEPPQAIAVNGDFGAVGLAYHAELGELFACTDGLIATVNPLDGQVADLMPLDSPCNNLTAPHEAIVCE